MGVYFRSRNFCRSLKFLFSYINKINYLKINKIDNFYLNPENRFIESGASTPQNSYMEYSGPSTPSNTSYIQNRPISIKSEVKKIMVPGSKSISNRALLLAALGKGKCKILGLLHSDDTRVMLDALKLLFNIKFEWLDDS